MAALPPISDQTTGMTSRRRGTGSVVSRNNPNVKIVTGIGVMPNIGIAQHVNRPHCVVVGDEDGQELFTREGQHLGGHTRALELTALQSGRRALESVL